MLHWCLSQVPRSATQIRVCAVHYLNTAPLVWGLLHGPQQGTVDLTFRSPAVCADALAAGQADVGLIPAVELLRLPVEAVPGVGITSDGPVRSILLVSKVAYSSIRTLAVDQSSRSSVALARIVLRERFDAAPRLVSRPPVLADMLAEADAALVIGDPALRIEPASLPYSVLDLGAEWTTLTGLPMVFAVWATRHKQEIGYLSNLFLSSYEYGRDALPEIVRQEAPKRSVTEQAAREYLTRYIRFPLGPREQAGLAMFLERARQLAPLPLPQAEEAVVL